MMRCAAFAPTRGRKASWPASAVLMLTTPAPAGVPVSANAAVPMRKIAVARMRERDFRRVMILLSFQLVVDRGKLAGSPHKMSVADLIAISLASTPPPFAAPEVQSGRHDAKKRKW